MLLNKETDIFWSVFSFADGMVSFRGCKSNVQVDQSPLRTRCRRVLGSNLPDPSLASLNLGHLFEEIFPASSPVAHFRSPVLKFAL